MAPKGDTKVDGAGRMVVLNTDSSQVEFQNSGLLFPISIHLLSGKIYAAVLGDQRIHSFDHQLPALEAKGLGLVPNGSPSKGEPGSIAQSSSRAQKLHFMTKVSFKPATKAWCWSRPCQSAIRAASSLQVPRWVAAWR